MTNNQLTEEELQTLIIELQQTAYRLNGTNSAYLMSDAIKPLRELQERRKSAMDSEHVRREHAAWSQATFGNVGPVGPLKHLSKEALEAAADPGDLSEWADMQFLMWDAQRRAGITDEQITQAMIEKLAVNKQREWPEPKDGEPRLHIKEQPAPVVPETAHSSVIAEQLANVLSDMKVTDHQRAVINCAVDRLNNVAQLLQLSPSALLVPEILDYQGAKELYNYLMTEEETNATVNAWNACRAAMLQAGYAVRDLSTPVDPQVAEYEQNVMHPGNYSVIGIDPASGPDRTVEVRYVAPPGYVMVPKEPTEAMINAWLSEVANWRGHVAGYKAMLATAPQEVKP